MRNDPEKASLLAHFWADRRYAAMLGLGFSSGIPFLLVYVTQSAWLSEAKVPIETIGLMRLPVSTISPNFRASECISC